MKRCYLYLFILIEMCCLSELSAKSCGKVFKGNDPAVRYVGRTLVSSDGSVSFDWVGTYWETRFTGGRLSLIVSETGTSYYNVFVDDELHRVVKVCGTDTLINVVSGIDKRLHSLRMQNVLRESLERQPSTDLCSLLRDSCRQVLLCVPVILSLSATRLLVGMGWMVGTVMSLLGWKRKTVIMPLQPW